MKSIDKPSMTLTPSKQVNHGVKGKPTTSRPPAPPSQSVKKEIYLFMCLNDVLGDTYYTDLEEVKKLVREANDKYGGDFGYRVLKPKEV